MRNKVYYIGFYNPQEIKEEGRANFPAANNKMEYIINLLKRNGYQTIIVNPSWTLSKKFYKGENILLNDNAYLKTFFTIPWSNKLFKSLSSRLMKLQLFFYLLLKVKKNDKIIVYHSIYYCKLFLKLIKIKKLNIVLEVEEIYQYINGLTKSEIKAENKMFSLANKYIYATEKMKDFISKEKNNIIINGNYLLKPKYNSKFEDSKIHIVYAGIIDKKKKSAFSILEIAKKFDNNYVFDILGFGNEEDVQDLKKQIEIFNNNNQAKIYYHGLLNGKEFDSFIQKCQYGLSCQDPNGIYNETSFPSKVLTYLTNRINVISIDLVVIRASKVNKLVNYFNRYDEIYNIVKNNKIKEKDIEKKLLEIDKEALRDLKYLIGDNK